LEVSVAAVAIQIEKIRLLNLPKRISSRLTGSVLKRENGVRTEVTFSPLSGMI